MNCYLFKSSKVIFSLPQGVYLLSNALISAFPGGLSQPKKLKPNSLKTPGPWPSAISNNSILLLKTVAADFSGNNPAKIVLQKQLFYWFLKTPAKIRWVSRSNLDIDNKQHITKGLYLLEPVHTPTIAEISYTFYRVKI